MAVDSAKCQNDWKNKKPTLFSGDGDKHNVEEQGVMGKKRVRGGVQFDSEELELSTTLPFPSPNGK